MNPLLKKVKLKFEHIPHLKRERGRNVPRVWFLEDQLKLRNDIIPALKYLFAGLRKLVRWINKPHTIKIGKHKIIIGLLAVIIFWPASHKIIYAEPSVKAPAPKMAAVAPNPQALPQTNLQAQEALVPIYVPPKAPVAQNVPQASCVYATGSNFYRDFIFKHESGYDCFAVNPSSAACGLGQAWPCSKLTSVCNLSDLNCQLAFWDRYAAGKGGWAASYAYWLAHSNW